MYSIIEKEARWAEISDFSLKTETIQIMAGAALLSACTYVPILARDHLGISEVEISIIVGVYAAASFFAS